MTSQRRPDELIRILRTDFAGSPGSPGGGGGGGGLFPQFVVTHGHTNVTDGTDNLNWNGASVKMIDLKNIICQGAFIIPAGYAGETCTIEALVLVNGVVNANLYLYAEINYSEIDSA